MLAKLLRPEPGGLLSRSAELTFGGRDETQSCTSSETLGFRTRLSVFFELGLEVMMIVGRLLELFGDEDDGNGWPGEAGNRLQSATSHSVVSSSTPYKASIAQTGDDFCWKLTGDGWLRRRGGVLPSLSGHLYLMLSVACFGWFSDQASLALARSQLRVDLQVVDPNNSQALLNLSIKSSSIPTSTLTSRTPLIKIAICGLARVMNGRYCLRWHLEMNHRRSNSKSTAIKYSICRLIRYAANPLVPLVSLRVSET
nr:hypothetical protein CFP56_20347 [Quercus suber]